jgi:hypothetical protein
LQNEKMYQLLHSNQKWVYCNVYDEALPGNDPTSGA